MSAFMRTTVCPKRVTLQRLMFLEAIPGDLRKDHIPKIVLGKCSCDVLLASDVKVIHVP